MQRLCEICGAPLKKRNKHCCSDICRKLWIIKQREENAIPDRLCLNPDCKKVLGRWHKKYCSMECMDICKDNKGRYKGKKEKETFYMVKCKCSACPDGKDIHERLLPYKPKIMPRIYCVNHEHNRYNDDYREAYNA